MDNPKSYCCAHCLSREAVVQCGNDCGAAFYCGQDCANEHYISHELQCLELVGHKPGEPTTTPGIVMVSGNFVMIRLLELNGDAAFQLARAHVVDRKLGWTVRAPHAWTDYQTGPHVTLTGDMKKYAGELVDVQLGSLFHYEDGPSRWVAFHATLPEKFKCPYGCHISVAQQRMK